MPDGLLQWYDAKGGVGRVVRGGREYPVGVDDIESHARVPGARVHFDVQRRRGVDVAAHVRLREGTRVSRRQRRFGDMAGARRPDTRGNAPFVRPHPELGRALATRPLEVARRWAERVGADDLQAAMLLYAPDAVVHTGDEELRGRKVQGWLSASGLLGHVRSIEAAGAGPYVEVRWTRLDGAPGRAWVRLAHGEIAEQWVGDATPPTGTVRAGGGSAEPQPAVEVVARDARAEAVVGYAEEKLRRVLARAGGPPVLHVRVKLANAPDPAVERPALAQAALDVNGQLVRAHVAAHTMTEAVDLLEERLRDRLAHRAERAKALHHLTVGSEPGEWRHGQRPTQRPARYDRPPGERQVVHHKSYSLGELTVDEAAFDMDMLDNDFHLFRELATGDDALLHRRPDGRYGLRRLRASPLTAAGAVVEVEVETDPAPSLTLDEALEWLQATDEPFVVFADAVTGRGNVVYHRYDGHYGLITPADEAAPPTEPATARRRLRAELDRLDAVRAALVSEDLELESETESISELASIDQHPADLGTETFEREKSLSLLADVEDEIADVQSALVRLDRGTYGRCVACGSQIPDERLAARPAAPFCLEHQAATEITQGLQR
jgi:RNA polymerase-binding transcription factor DksA